MGKRLYAGGDAPVFVFDTPWKKGLRLSDSIKKGPTVLVFLRYIGCPVCQMEVARFRADFDEFKRRKTELLVVLQSEPATITKATSEKDIPFPIVCDPKGDIFSLYGVNAGSIFSYLSPGSTMGALRAIRRGFKHGKFEGKEMQLPAAFVIDKNQRITFAYYGKNVADVPKTDVLLKIIDRG
jgi:peroxiredoxin